MTSKLQPTVDLGYPTGQHGEIPSFDNVEEEAEFWDTHEVMDNGNEGWTVRRLDPSELDDRFIVLLDPEGRDALIERARERDMEPSALATAWLEDRLRQELEKKAS